MKIFPAKFKIFRSSYPIILRQNTYKDLDKALSIWYNITMKDHNYSAPSKQCPKCKKISFRLYSFVTFIRHYLCYCESCQYKTDASVSEHSGWKEWDEIEKL